MDLFDHELFGVPVLKEAIFDTNFLVILQSWLLEIFIYTGSKASRVREIGTFCDQDSFFLPS